MYRWVNNLVEKGCPRWLAEFIVVWEVFAIGFLVLFLVYIAYLLIWY